MPAVAPAGACRVPGRPGAVPALSWAPAEDSAVAAAAPPAVSAAAAAITTSRSRARRSWLGAGFRDVFIGQLP